MTEDEEMNLRRENEGVLRNLGYLPDVGRAPRRVDFSLVFPTLAARSDAKTPVTALGFEWSEDDEAVEEGTFEATATKMLLPTTASITESEIKLLECLAPFDARTDGWGFLDDTVH